ncbi:MAG: MFS transporter, partial [Myxococcales bacterium]|nr:MFS transporter [Myxococcales bacterium]
MTSGVSISSERANSDRSRPSDREVSSGSAFSAFRIPHFAPLWTSNLLQYFSFQMQRIALQWLVTELTSSRTLLGMVGFMQGATMVVVSPMAGVLIDRAPKRTLVGSGRFMLASLSSLLAVLAGSGLVEIWHILAIAVMTGAVMASTQPAIQTLVFDIA